MEREVLKYELPFMSIGQEIEVMLPQFYVMTDIEIQNRAIYLWAIVDRKAKQEPNKFITFGTGWPIDDISNYHFLKTIHHPEGLVLHVFRVADNSDKDSPKF